MDEHRELHLGVGRGVLDGVRAGFRGCHLDIEALALGKTRLNGERQNEFASVAGFAQV